MRELSHLLFQQLQGYGKAVDHGLPVQSSCGPQVRFLQNSYGIPNYAIPKTSVPSIICSCNLIGGLKVHELVQINVFLFSCSDKVVVFAPSHWLREHVVAMLAEFKGGVYLHNDFLAFFALILNKNLRVSLQQNARVHPEPQGCHC